MRVAVIGTGISGNVAARHLSETHDVTVFEANRYVGGHTHTHDVVWGGKHYAIDTGFIVFNEKTYPQFIQLLETLGVESQETEMSFSVSSLSSGLEYNGHSLNTLFAQRSNLLSASFYRMIRDILRFNQTATDCLSNDAADMPLGEFLRQEQYGREFIDHYILPMGAAIWSTDVGQMQDFPARFFIRFFHNHGLLNVSNRPRWFVIKGGSKQYLTPLTKSYQNNIRLGAAVERVQRSNGGWDVYVKQGKPEYFDAVFVAAHSDQALSMLATPSVAQQEVLGAIRYQENEAVLHTDTSVLPRRKRAWASWNYRIPEKNRDRVVLTYYMNRLQGINAPVDFCVTLNDSSAIDRSKIIQRIVYEHPVFTTETIAAQERQRDVNGQGLYFCGAYWRNGFHEDGVVSALNAIRHFEEDLVNEKLHLRRAG